MIQFYLNPLTIIGFRNKRFPHSRPGFPIKHDSNPYILKVTQQFRWSYFELGPSCDLRTKRVRSWWKAGVWRLGTQENSPGNSLFFPNPSHRLPLLPASFKESLISGNCPLCLRIVSQPLFWQENTMVTVKLQMRNHKSKCRLFINQETT